LEKRRQCGWLGAHVIPGPIVWARGRTGTSECPTSYISAESISLLEEYQTVKLLGVTDYRAVPARVVEAMFVLENESRTERGDGAE